MLAYPVLKAYRRHRLGTTVTRCLGVAHFTLSRKTAQDLGCSLTAKLRVTFGRVTYMARAASVPGLWTLGFLLLCGACVWVWVLPLLRHYQLGVCVRSWLCLNPAFPGWGRWRACSGWGFRLNPANRGPGPWRVCLGMGFALTPPIVAQVCGTCVSKQVLP